MESLRDSLIIYLFLIFDFSLFVEFIFKSSLSFSIFLKLLRSIAWQKSFFVPFGFLH